MVRTLFPTLVIAALLTVPAAAQEPRTEQQPTPKPADSAPRPADPIGQHVNIRLELTITDQAGPGEPSKKVVTMVVADRQHGSIRTKGFQPRPGNQFREVIINVDASPTILRDGRVHLIMALEYSPTTPSESGGGQSGASDQGRSTLNERITFVIDPGKPLVVSQAVDPLSDRRITVEVRATMTK
jgi:hypothetical protein